MPNKSLSRSSLLTYQKYSSLLVGNTPYEPYSLELIETVNVEVGGTTEINFTNLSSFAGTYGALQIHYVENHTSNSNVYMQFNGDTTSNYGRHDLYGTGSTLGFDGQTSTEIMLGYYNGTNLNQSAAAVVTIVDPFNTSIGTTVKVLSGTYTSATNYIFQRGGVWYGTAAVDSIRIYLQVAGTINEESRFSIYGVRI